MGQVGTDAGRVLQSHMDPKHESMASQLRPLLSENASTSFAGDAGFAAVTDRWSSYNAPGFVTAVQVATENDVVETVKQANLSGLPWLAVTGQHGTIGTLGAFRSGVEIHMARLNSIVIDEDGTTATIGGGTLTMDITNTLWAHGKQTVTGVCETTSLIGPMLGGGHGWLQGRYGLGVDQLVSARLVLPSGELIEVSDDSHPDLFWGLRGAGHNFGIVTAVKYKIYDVPAERRRWTYATLVFTEDKLEGVFKATNKVTDGGNGPVELMQWLVYVRNPELDTRNPVIAVRFLYEGPGTAAKTYLDLYRAVGPAHEEVVETEYPGIAALFGFDKDGPTGKRGVDYHQMFPVGMKTYDLPTQRRLFRRFAEVTADERFSESVYVFESYSMRAVAAVDADSTAFPDRFNNCLTSPLINYLNPKDDADAASAGQSLRAIALEGKTGEHIAYVNYANGDEAPENWYGHESWRLDRLRALKKKYDPHGRLCYYAPIP